VIGKFIGILQGLFKDLVRILLGIPKGFFKGSVKTTQGILRGLFSEFHGILQGFFKDYEGEFYKEHIILWETRKGFKRGGSTRSSIRFNNDFDRGPKRIL